MKYKVGQKFKCKIDVVFMINRGSGQVCFGLKKHKNDFVKEYIIIDTDPITQIVGIGDKSKLGQHYHLEFIFENKKRYFDLLETAMDLNLDKQTARLQSDDNPFYTGKYKF